MSAPDPAGVSAPDPADLSQGRSFRIMCAITAGLAVITLVAVPLFPEIEALIIQIANQIERMIRERGP